MLHSHLIIKSIQQSITSGLPMNQQLLEHIYLNYQPTAYFSQYLAAHKVRHDSRPITQHRALKISVSDGGRCVTASRGGTIVIAQLTSSVDKVVFSPISNSYGRQLLTVVVSPGSALGKVERNASRSLQAYVDQFVDWSQIEKQLVHCHTDHQLYAHVGTICVRVAGSDGCVQETLLFAVQLVLLTAQFQDLGQYLMERQQGIQNSSQIKRFMLDLTGLKFSIKYVEIVGQLLVDPTEREQQSSDYELTLISNIGPGHQLEPAIRVVKVQRSNSPGEQKIATIEKLHAVTLSKLSLGINELRSRCFESQGGCQQLTIQGL